MPVSYTHLGTGGGDRRIQPPVRRAGGCPGTGLHAPDTPGAHRAYGRADAVPVVFGLSLIHISLCDGVLSLPMAGGGTGVDSFNVSVATGIILYEIMRQRGTEGSI